MIALPLLLNDLFSPDMLALIWIVESKKKMFLNQYHLFIKLISEDKFLSPILQKSYSVELIIILLNRNECRGYNFLFNQLSSQKPQFASFVKFIQLLKELDIIQVEVSEAKRSQLSFKLTENSRNKIEGIVETVGRINQFELFAS